MKNNVVDNNQTNNPRHLHDMDYKQQTKGLNIAAQIVLDCGKQAYLKINYKEKADE